MMYNGGTRQGELDRSAELYTQILEEQGAYFEIKTEDGDAEGYFGRSYDSTQRRNGGEWHRVENEELFFKCLLNVARASDTDAFEGDPFKYSANTSECTCVGNVCVNYCTSSVMDYK